MSFAYLPPARCLLFSRAGALASGCKVTVTPVAEMWEIRQNKTLGKIPPPLWTTAGSERSLPAADEVANIILNKYGSIDYEWGIKSASTDFVSKETIM
jgi:hypothetical protein